MTMRYAHLSPDHLAEARKLNPLADLDEDNMAGQSMEPASREWSSPDFDRLIDEDTKKFATDLAQWIRHSHRVCEATILDPELSADTLNIQIALRQLGQEVTLEVAAAVWKNYSKSVSASWMSGAETVESAKRTLFLNCPRDGIKTGHEHSAVRKNK